MSNSIIDQEIVISVNSLSPETTSEGLKNFFTINGYTLSSANVIKNKKFGFIRFQELQEAKKCIRLMQGAMIDGKKVFLRMQNPDDKIKKNP
jgi:RNA recognition motif-containing protein